jgi:hypothetical protein
MHWFRAERSPSSYVALLALALQLAVSFGHVHFDGLALGTATVAAALGPSEPEGGPSGTPDREDVCAICAVISLAGSLLIPDAPALSFTGAQHEAFFPDLIGVLDADPARAQFQARAPPA